MDNPSLPNPNQKRKPSPMKGKTYPEFLSERIGFDVSKMFWIKPWGEFYLDHVNTKQLYQRMEPQSFYFGWYISPKDDGLQKLYAYAAETGKEFKLFKYKRNGMPGYWVVRIK